MAESGWISLHRKIRNNWIWQDPEKLRAWLDILLMVNHEDKSIPYNGKIITVKKGQKLTSIVKLAERWGWSRHRVYRFLSLLKADNMCNIDSTTNGTLITVVKWDLYQIQGTANGTTNGTADDTANGTTGGTQTIINNNDKQHNNARARARRESDHDRVFAEFLELVAEKEREEQERKNDSEGVRRDPENIERPLQAL
ncbi:MAG: hypothetical protein IJQ02_14350 [Oscillospiraceae bacterium]|nr:hypothetical protein [Oscillospiraceae bacterium]